MSPSLRQIRSFIAVGRCGSFTKAAQLLHLSQPALTVRIRQLEDILGLQLFDRNTRVVRLTRLGRELLPKLERLQVEFDAVISGTKDLAGGRIGVVHLACLPSFAASVLPGAITAFREIYPQVSFILKDAPWRRVVAMVRSEEVDFGVGDIVSTEPELEFVRIHEDKMQVVYPARHPVDRMPAVTLKELATFPLVMMDPETSARPMVDAAFAAAGCRPVRACEVMYTGTAVAMVRAGLGIAILPASATEWRAHRGLKVRPIEEPTFVRHVGLIKKPSRSLPPASAAFAESLRRAWRNSGGDRADRGP